MVTDTLDYIHNLTLVNMNMNMKIKNLAYLQPKNNAIMQTHWFIPTGVNFTVIRSSSRTLRPRGSGFRSYDHVHAE